MAGVRFPVGPGTFSSPPLTDTLCGPTSLLFNGNRGLKWPDCEILYPLPRLRICGAVHPLPYTSLWYGV